VLSSALLGEHARPAGPSQASGAPYLDGIKKTPTGLVGVMGFLTKRTTGPSYPLRSFSVVLRILRRSRKLIQWRVGSE
jgi:hypothetical protein